MTRRALNDELRQRLAGLPAEDVEASLEYYNEMINDRMEDGLSEEEAVEALGSLDEIVDGILAETPLPKLIQERIRPKRSVRAWEIVLLVLGFPVWFPILAALAAVIFAVFVSFWAVVLSFYAVTLALGLAGLAALVAVVPALIDGAAVTYAILLFGGGLVCLGLAIGFFFLSTLLARGLIALGRLTLLGIKRCISGKERKA